MSKLRLFDKDLADSITKSSKDATNKAIKLLQEIEKIVNSPEAQRDDLTYTYIKLEVDKLFKIKIAEGKIDPEFAKDVQEVIIKSMHLSEY